MGHNSNLVLKRSLPELYTVDEVEKCKFPIEFNVRHLSLDEKIKLFNKIENLDLWSKLNMPIYAILDCALGIEKGCNSKKGWEWIADSLIKLYRSEFINFAYDDIVHRFIQKKFKELGIKHKILDWVDCVDPKHMKGFYYYNSFDYVRRTLSFSIAFGFKMSDDERKKVMEYIGTDDDITTLIIREKLISFGVTPDEMIEHFPEIFVS